MSLSTRNLTLKDASVNNITLSSTALDITSSAGDIVFDTAGGIDFDNIILNNNEIQDAGLILSPNNDITIRAPSNIFMNVGGANKVRIDSSYIELVEPPRTTVDLVPTTSANELLTMASFMSVGTFTPSLVSNGGAGAPVYSTANTYCRYQRMGRIVNISLRLSITSKGTLPAGDVRITLPFTCSGRSNINQGLCIGNTTNLSGSIVDLFCSTVEGTDYCILYKKETETTVNTTILQVSNILATFTISLGGCYFTTDVFP